MQPNFRLYQLTKESSKNLDYSLNLFNEYVVMTELHIVQPLAPYKEENLYSFLGDTRWVFQVGNVIDYEQYAGKNRITGTRQIFCLQDNKIRLETDKDYVVWAPLVEFFFDNEIYQARLKDVGNIFDKNNPFPSEGIPLFPSPNKVQNFICFFLIEKRCSIH